MRPLDLPCGEQGKLPTAKAFKLAERDKFMSEQEKPKSFMQDLDLWIEANVIGAMLVAETNPEEWAGWEERVTKAIRAKVLESYRNGQQAAPRKFNQPPKGNR